VSDEHVQDLFTAKMNGQSGSPTRKAAEEGGAAVHVFTAFTADDDLDDEESL
jgi:hypothetical protein